MRDIVVVPVFQRPELLALALEAVTKADHADEHFYVFRLDRGHDPDNVSVISRFPFDHKIVEVHAHGYAGDAFNTLMGYQQGLNEGKRTGAGLVYLLQEDVIVARDFFAFHREVQRRYLPFVAASFYIQKWVPTQPPPRTDAAFLSRRFHPYGLSWRPENLGPILKHATPEYLADQRGYVERTFPNSAIGHGLGEQDWLIDNVMQLLREKCLVPSCPRAYDAGYYSDRREAWRPRGALWQRVEETRALLADRARLEKVTGDYPVRPIPLDRPAAKVVMLVEV